MARFELRLGERHRAAGKAGHVQQVVHESHQVLDLTNDGVDVLTPLRVDPAFEKSSGGEDRGQRVAQLVRKKREELVLSAIGHAQCILDRALSGHVGYRVDQTGHAVDVSTNAGQDDADGSPVFAALRDLETPLRNAAHRVEKLRALFGGPQSELDGGLADGFLARQSEELQERIVDDEESSIRLARDGQGLRTQMEDRLESPFGGSQRVLGRAPVVDVECHRDPSNDVAVSVSDRRSAREMPPILAAPCFEFDIRTRPESTFRAHVPSDAPRHLDRRRVRRRAPLCR